MTLASYASFRRRHSSYDFIPPLLGGLILLIVCLKLSAGGFQNLANYLFVLMRKKKTKIYILPDAAF